MLIMAPFTLRLTINEIFAKTCRPGRGKTSLFIPDLN